MIAFDPDPGGLSHRSQRLRQSGVLEDFFFFWAFNRIPIHWCGSEVAFQGGVPSSTRFLVPFEV